MLARVGLSILVILQQDVTTEFVFMYVDSTIYVLFAYFRADIVYLSPCSYFLSDFIANHLLLSVCEVLGFNIADNSAGKSTFGITASFVTHSVNS